MRRLAYLYIVSEQPAILSIFIDRNYDKTSCDDRKSYFNGLIGSCIIIGRNGVHQIKEEKIFEKTVSALDEIKNDLFNNEFTAADLTLSSLIQPLRLIEPFKIKYKSIFDYCCRIREDHDPKKKHQSNVLHLCQNRSQKKESIVRNAISSTSNFLFNDNDKNQSQKSFNLLIFF